MKFINLLCQNSEKRAVQAIMGILESPVKAWHCAAAELLGRMIINPDNEPFLLPFVPQVYTFCLRLIPQYECIALAINCNADLISTADT